MTHPATHRSLRFVHRVPAPPAEVFPLLCPVREHDWVEGWQAEVLHSESGVAELGCVFLADARGTHGPVTFVVSTDSHHTRELGRMEWGALHATRGWVDPSRVANTRPREKFLAWLRERRA